MMMVMMPIIIKVTMTGNYNNHDSNYSTYVCDSDQTNQDDGEQYC